MATNPSEGAHSIVERIARCVEGLTGLLPMDEHIAALGICCPGPVDQESGNLCDPPNLAGLHYAPLRQLLATRLQLPVSLEHDARAAALGEFYYGSGRGELSMVYVVVGTGVGAAIIVDGKLFRGPYNSAGEIGHVALDRDGDICSCGNRGCVETFLSGPWLARRFARAANGHVTDPGAAAITGEAVVELAGRGDALARRVMDEAGAALGTAVATMSMVLSVDLYVIGGSVAKAGDLLLEPARREVSRHCFRSVSCEIGIVPAELGDDGPILGCAWLARQLRHGHGAHGGGSMPRRLTHSEQTRLEQVEGMVFDIQRFSLHDGAGLRTNVFFKGCAMRCPWCANPESQHREPELWYSAQRCIDCGQFSPACRDCKGRNGAAVGLTGMPDRVARCPTGALRVVGERRTAADILAEVLRDVPFYEGGGGMTLTGGEPAFQPRLAEALLRLARHHQIATAVETSGHTRWRVVERLLPYVDEVLFDLKHVDGAIHRAATGVDTELILANLHRLATLHAPLTVRVPLIPGFNTDETSLSAIADCVRALDGPPRPVHLLPYHTLGRAKYGALNRQYPWEGHDRLTDTQIAACRAVFDSCGLSVSVGG